MIVGKRALPGLSLTADAATVTGIAERTWARLPRPARYLRNSPADVASASRPTGTQNMLNGLLTAHRMGMLTIALAGAAPSAAASMDHLIATTLRPV